MKRHELPSHKQVQSQVGQIKDDLDTFHTEYRWLEGMFYSPDKTDSGRSSGVSTPTENVATGKTYASRRELARSALRQLEEAGEIVKAALGLLASAQPRYSPSEGAMDKAAIQSRPFIREQNEKLAKRLKEGGGFGQT